jgi:hypothetical protein
MMTSLLNQGILLKHIDGFIALSHASNSDQATSYSCPARAAVYGPEPALRSRPRVALSSGSGKWLFKWSKVDLKRKSNRLENRPITENKMRQKCYLCLRTPVTHLSELYTMLPLFQGSHAPDH